MSAIATNPEVDPRDRLLELLADRALVGLDDVEALELDRLFLNQPELDDESMDVAAAALCVAGIHDARSALPPALRERVRASSGRWLDSVQRRGPTRLAFVAAASSTTGAPGPAPGDRAERTHSGRRLDGLGWLAAAAALVLAALAWWPSLVLKRSVEQERAQLLRAERELGSTRTVEWPWTRIEHALCAERIDGDVVWSGDRQQGFLRISGLAPNDPTTLQYQLWIFDATRDERFPVDGGVFDVPPDCGEAIIPIRAAVDVREPVMFAVTVEPPGGVVVSKRELVAVAKPSPLPPPRERVPRSGG